MNRRTCFSWIKNFIYQKTRKDWRFSDRSMGKGNFKMYTNKPSIQKNLHKSTDTRKKMRTANTNNSLNTAIPAKSRKITVTLHINFENNL